jgi:hypothetical protein
MTVVLFMVITCRFSRKLWVSGTTLESHLALAVKKAIISMVSGHGWHGCRVFFDPHGRLELGDDDWHVAGPWSSLSPIFGVVRLPGMPTIPIACTACRPGTNHKYS